MERIIIITLIIVINKNKVLISLGTWHSIEWCYRHKVLRIYVQVMLHTFILPSFLLWFHFPFNSVSSQETIYDCEKETFIRFTPCNGWWCCFSCYGIEKIHSRLAFLRHQWQPSRLNHSYKLFSIFQTNEKNELFYGISEAAFITATIPITTAIVSPTYQLTHQINQPNEKDSIKPNSIVISKNKFNVHHDEKGEKKYAFKVKTISIWFSNRQTADCWPTFKQLLLFYSSLYFIFYILLHSLSYVYPWLMYFLILTHLFLYLTRTI